jgi:hypothetical protein
MNCGGSIANGEVRLGNLATSHIFEGFQCCWMHLTCAINGGCGGIKIKQITQLKGWDPQPARPARGIAEPPLIILLASKIVPSSARSNADAVARSGLYYRYRQ